MGNRTHGFEVFDEAFPNRSGCVRRRPVSGRLCIDRASLDHVFEVADVQRADFLAPYTGGKTVQDAAVDFLSLWQRLQFEQQNSNLQPLHQPQPLPVRRETFDVNAVDSDDDDDEGFWDLRADWYERRSRAREEVDVNVVHRQPYSLLRVDRITITNDVQAERFASSSSISRRRITMEYSGGVLPGSLCMNACVSAFST